MSMRRMAIAMLVLAAVTVSGQTLDLRVEAPPALEGAAARVRSIDRQALAAALAGAGLEMPTRVHIAHVDVEVARAKRAPRWVVGRAFGTEYVEIFPDRVSRYPYDSLDGVVRHEIVHLALTARAGDMPLPRWFHEGVATTVEGGWGVGDQLRLLAAALDRPTITDVDRLFGSDSAPVTAQAYLLAAALVNDIRQRHGQDVPGRVAASVAAGVPFDTAFRRVTGQSVNEATAGAWAGYRRVATWLPAATGSGALWTFILALSFVAFVAQLRRRARPRRRWEEEDEQDDDRFRLIDGE